MRARRKNRIRSVNGRGDQGAGEKEEKVWQGIGRRKEKHTIRGNSSTSCQKVWSEAGKKTVKEGKRGDQPCSKDFQWGNLELAPARKRNPGKRRWTRGPGKEGKVALDRQAV